MLADLCDGRDLTSEVAEAVLTEILVGEAEPAQIAAFLVALKIKGETAEETTGLVRAMLSAAEPNPTSLVFFSSSPHQLSIRGQ